MIRLTDDVEEEPDAEEEQLRALLNARQLQKRKKESRAIERKLQAQEEAAASAARAAAEDAELERGKRDACARVQQMAQPLYRIADSDSRQVMPPSSRQLHSEPASRRPTASQRRGPRGGPASRSQGARPQISDFADVEEFRPTSAQPAMFDTMQLAPGVSMVESGRAKASPQTPTKHMTLGDYWKFQAASAGNTDNTLRLSSAPASDQFALDASHENSLGLGSLPASDQLGSFRLGSAPASDQLGSSVSPYERLLMSQPLPCSASRSRTYRYAHSLPRSTRERQPTLGMHDTGLRRSLRPTAAQPRLGATMGHGLLDSNGHENIAPAFSSVRKTSGDLDKPSRRLSKSDSSSSIGGGKGGGGGGKITVNHELFRNLFHNISG
mmetsp:Transcript_21210/g.38593  ORF Transcript_21210/g.38593 Transcript_21210/m.38593 type:complete len:383 (-) Transcript_21210:8-1156(-)